MLKKNYLFYAAIAFLFSSCSSVYMPNVPNTPMLSKAGEFSGGGHISFRGNTSLNGAYAISDHIGIIASGSNMKSNRKSKDFHHKLIEVGGGYFDTFGPDDNRIIEIYGGFGKGWSNITNRDYDNDILISSEVQDVDYRKSFLQVNYSSKKEDKLTLFGTKFGINYGTALRISHISADRFFINGVLQAKEDNVFFEPIFFTRMLITKNFQLQYTTSSNIGLKSRKYISAGNSIFTIGAIFNIGGK